MSKKIGKVILFGAIAGAAAYGVYYYLNKKKAEAAATDGEATTGRSYVPLNMDTAKAYVGETYEKAKEAIRKAEAKIEESGVFQKSSTPSGDQAPASENVDSDVEPLDAETAEDFDKDLEKEAVPEQTEEFFDDEEK